MISTLVLDLDGPLLDGMERHYRCYSKILEEHGFEPIPISQFWELKRTRVDRRKLLELSDALSLYDEYLGTWRQRIETKKYLALDRLQNGVADILSNWEKTGMRLLLATMRNNRANLFWQLEQLGIRRFFDSVVAVGSHPGGTNKASEIRSKLEGVDTRKVVWIGDTEVDVHAARELGVAVCALVCGLRTSEYLLSLSPDFLEKDLRSFADKMTESCQ